MPHLLFLRTELQLAGLLTLLVEERHDVLLPGAQLRHWDATLACACSR